LLTLLGQDKAEAIQGTKDSETMKKRQAIQQKIGEINKLQDAFGGYRPDLINMYFAAKLERLTKVLIWLTAVLSALAIIQIILLVRN